MSWIANYLHRAAEHYYDLRLGIRTCGYVTAGQLGHTSECLEYTPIPYRALYRLLRALPADARNGKLVDFGCGQGRVLVAAYEAGYRTVGVELSDNLCAEARRNVGARPIEVWPGDATRFPIPDDTSVCLFYNPFTGDTLARVLDKIEASVAARPRPCFCAAHTLKHFEEAVDGRSRFVREYHASFAYPRSGMAIYRVRD